MLKVKNKENRICKVNDKVKNKETVDVVLATLLLTLSAFHFLSHFFVTLFILLWCFVPARINLGNVSTYGETR